MTGRTHESVFRLHPYASSRSHNTSAPGLATERFDQIASFECATRDWVDWFNTRRLLEPIGYVPPAEFEECSYQQAAVA